MRTTSILIKIAFLLTVVLFPAAQLLAQDSEKVEYLVHAVEKLKRKTIPQAYFWLGSPQVPDSTIFAPDTKGGAFVIIARNHQLPDGTSQIFYQKDDWDHLAATVKRWTVSREEISGLAFANQWKLVNDEILVLRIPYSTEDFFTALLKGWRSNGNDFRCGTHWN